MKLIVLNAHSAAKVSPVQEGLGRTVMLRVTSYKHFHNLEFRDEFVDVFALKFPDIEESEIYTPTGAGLIPIQPHQAQKIVEWARQHADCDTMIVHCDAGYSRSPAMALAVADVLSLPEESRKLQELVERRVYCPNRTVYRRITEAAGLRAQRQQELEDAFAKADGNQFI